ncbi:MAG: hypothetical protein JJ975_06040 [Bacteroidia bacterium]|nr:hypothetical protein [Bacteroidia bacterium]
MNQIQKNKKKLLDYVSVVRKDSIFPPVVSHSSEFPGMGGYMLEDFYHVSVYGGIPDSNFLKLGEINAVVENTYLPSFCNDIFSCWLYHMNQGRTTDFQNVLSYNFKKYYAEQLYWRCSSNFSRAIFLETLLYEQDQMVPIVNELSKSVKTRSYSELSVSIATSLISLHELAHLYLNSENKLWASLNQEYGQIIAPMYDDVKSNYGDAFATEIRCDMFAILMSVKLLERDWDMADILNIIIYHSNSFGLFYSLGRSAKVTYDQNRKNWESEKVDFTSIDPYDSNDVYSIVPDKTMVLRSQLMISFCERIAQKSKAKIYDQNPQLPLSKQLLIQYVGVVDRMMEPKNPMARNMALLCARAFHDHPKGMDYLLLRSKKFNRRN